jgi:hypothetical protein
VLTAIVRNENTNKVVGALVAAPKAFRTGSRGFFGSGMLAAAVREAEQRLRPRCLLPTWDSPVTRTVPRHRPRAPPLLAISVRSFSDRYGFIARLQVNKGVPNDHQESDACSTGSHRG